jgi:hypothetical protein
VLYCDHEARLQFARERVAELAQEARSIRASRANREVYSRASFVSRLVQAWQARKHTPHQAPAFRA